MMIMAAMNTTPATAIAVAKMVAVDCEVVAVGCEIVAVGCEIVAAVWNKVHHENCEVSIWT